jgi:hypothetical protein
VRIVTHEKIEESTESRSLEDERFKKFKQVLVSALEI